MLKVEMIGNLGADAQIKESNGSKFVTMRMAHTDKYVAEGGEVKETTIWVDVTYNNSESKVVGFLKAGIKVFVRGHARLRVYSSEKDRCMKAGLTIVATEIELCGGVADEVPRQLFAPENGNMFKVAKYYQSDVDTSKWKKDDHCILVDKQSNRYVVVKGGWVAPEIVEPESAENTQEQVQ